MRSALKTLIEEIRQDRALDDPEHLRQRSEALDRLDAYLLNGQVPAFESSFADAKFYEQASALYGRLEAVNSALCQSIRREIQQGAGSQHLRSLLESSRQDALVHGEGYDYLDELMSGILQFKEPEDEIQVEAEMVFYQPTPARHIFDLLDRTLLTEDDVLIDLGSGLGHVSLLVSICSSAHVVGIELEPAYVDSARKSAQSLHLSNVTFLQQDARAADLSSGTVFYLYTPFTGTVLRTVLDALRQQAGQREIRVCTLGPCTPVIAKEAWLATAEPVAEDRVTIFRSCG